MQARKNWGLVCPVAHPPSTDEVTPAKNTTPLTNITTTTTTESLSITVVPNHSRFLKPDPFAKWPFSFLRHIFKEVLGVHNDKKLNQGRDIRGPRPTFSGSDEMLNSGWRLETANILTLAEPQPCSRVV